MKPEEIVRASQVKVDEQREKLWRTTLIFLAGEWFGEEVLNEFLAYRYTGDPIAEGEKQINVVLGEHEKMMWNLVDTVFNYLRKHRKRIPSGELEEKKKIAAGLKAQFWAMIQLNHPECMEPDNIGIRENYVIVEGPMMPSNPLIEIIKGGF